MTVSKKLIIIPRKIKVNINRRENNDNNNNNNNNNNTISSINESYCFVPNPKRVLKTRMSLTSFLK
jgi:hypothetical protein